MRSGILRWTRVLVAVTAGIVLARPSGGCVSDCNADATVTINELVLSVNIALDTAPVTVCDAADNNRDGRVTVDELVRGVNRALTTCQIGAAGEVLLSAQGARLDEYDLATGAVTEIVPTTRGTITGQICVVPGGAGNLVVGDDTGDAPHGWSLFCPDGTFLAKLPLSLAQDQQTQGGEPIGCAAAADGRIFATAIGTPAGADGQLRVYFPPTYDFGCLIDGTLRAPGEIAIDNDGAIYVPESVESGSVLRFAPPFPADPNECELSQGVPTRPHTPFITYSDGTVPRAIVPDAAGDWYVAASAGGDGPGIRHHAHDGAFVEELLPAGTRGVPAALTFDGAGALYYADLGVGAGSAAGTLRRVAFDLAGGAQPPELVARGLSNPNGVTVVPSRDEVLTLGGSYRRTFFYPRERVLNRKTASKLVKKWQYFTSGMISAQPAVTWIDPPGKSRTQVLIVSSWDRYVYALRADNGSRVWSYQRKPQPGTFYPFAASPTIAWIDGQQRIFVPGGETMYCLDADTGEEVWQFDAGTGCTTCDTRHERNEIEATPAVVNGLVIASMDINDSLPGKGGVFALRAGDGSLAWWFDLETTKTCRPSSTDTIKHFDGFHTAAELGLPEDFLATRPGCDFDRVSHACGSVWSSPAVDLRRGLFYMSSGNCDTDDDPESTPPPPPMPPYEEAIFAVSLNGDPVWVWRPREVDNDDFDFGAVPNLFEAEIGGAVRELVGVGCKDGTYYVLDRDGVNEITGVIEPYWQTNVVPGGPAGGMIGSASVGEGRIVVATAPGFDPFDPQRPTVHAFEAGTGEIAWQYPDVPPDFGPTVGVPGVAITGSTPTPFLNIFDTANGALLTRIAGTTTVSGIAAAPAILNGNVFSGGGTGAFNSGRDAAGQAVTDTPLTAFCVEGTPGCTPNTCNDGNTCTYDYLDGEGKCVSEPSAEDLDCRAGPGIAGKCAAGLCVATP